MEEIFYRTELLIGEDKLRILKKSKVAVFGVGGVGGYVVEALARSGVGNLCLIDADSVAPSNINRQIIASMHTLGQSKVSVAEKRVKGINPLINVKTYSVFYLPENADLIDLTEYDYVIDAIDTVTAKIELIKRAKALGIPIISCMGTGGKTDVSRLKVADIYKTFGCPLAKVMRSELKKAGIESLKVVFSDEPFCSFCNDPLKENKNERKTVPSMIFVPAAAGLMLAREAVFDLIDKN